MIEWYPSCVRALVAVVLVFAERRLLLLLDDWGVSIFSFSKSNYSLHQRQPAPLFTEACV